jgi:hypothetical protein
MAAPIPYVSHPYDSRQYTASMADLIGRRGDINTQANYARGMASANMVGNLAGIAANAVGQYAQMGEARRKEEKIDQEKNRPRQIQAMVAGLPEAKREEALRGMGEWEMADREANRQTDNVLRRMNIEHAQRVDAQDRSEEIANRLYTIEKAPADERAWHYNEALPDLKKLAGPHADQIPDIYDASTFPMLREKALTFKDHIAQEAARTSAANKAAEQLQHDWKGLVEVTGRQLRALGDKATPDQWNGVIAGQPVSAEAKKLLASVFSTPTPEMMASRIQEAGRLGGVDPQPKTPEAQRVQAFALDRHPDSPVMTTGAREARKSRSHAEGHGRSVDKAADAARSRSGARRV